MPQGENFWNPYRMVPIKDEIPERHAPLTHECYQGLSGEIEATLITLTPLLIGVQRESSKTHISNSHSNSPILPGSSLKGMIRSLAEIVGNGCDVMNTSDHTHNKCTDQKKLCICCRIFGMQHDKQSFLGKVSFGEGVWKGNGRAGIMQRQRVLLSNPKERHSAFYLSGKKIRKLYHHNPSRVTVIPQAKSTDSENMVAYLTPLKSGETFVFKVSFSNLEETELALLLYCLSLERNVAVKVNGRELTGDLYHKLGMGKPIGMGSVRIDLIKMSLKALNHSDRYRSWAGTQNDVKEGEVLTAELSRRTAALRSDDSLTMRYLRSMLFWLPDDDRSYRYPEQNWFNSHGSVALKNPVTGR